ncbi:LSU ribosomal protein L3P [Desulfobulbus propionicus DSM 2032]|jgi:large subunit ribosomal protein L3|uniref:Large ribosomal subunit protein uL3 n=1 Tax=Desulfobulbus propionicus (strain ATCC 33891 / DSM 2032 / VKM B-1956 / 1pr3) TaxID=577650 RepID=A0A7U3YKB5_DESPD|nr:50S ribosomal protein L3 [Desulfobulbus propionicus]ADW16965.1 LSU ribosomal protein L3P [Desulfobulbus propionicus DSM 2032]
MPNTKGILGRKLGMTRVYDENGRSIPVTVIEAGPCTILQKKTVEKEGYNAIQVGFLEKKETRMNKPEVGHCKRSGGKGFYYIKEFRVTNPDVYEVGQQITVSEIVSIGDLVDISGKSKGRGFQGVIKRHGFAGGRTTHGSDFHRAPGSIGCSAWPSRVLKGKKLPGRMGNESMTQKNLRIIDIRNEDNVLLVRGTVPGAKNGLLNIYSKG